MWNNLKQNEHFFNLWIILALNKIGSNNVHCDHVIAWMISRVLLKQRHIVY